ncbi:aspartate kinase [Metallumcola ferriviriculae]
MLVVQKFGGSSVADPERIKRVAKRVVETKRAGNSVVVVVSAMGDTTDELIGLARQLSDTPSEREMDMLLSTGEQVSIALLAMAIENLGEAAVSLTGAQAGVSTNEVYAKAKITGINSERLDKELAAGKIVVVAGFQGRCANDDTTTLGRGGSDTTAVALAAAIKADVCEIFTDVDGVYTTDPRVVPRAQKLPSISYDEMLELASLGALVLHPRAVEFAKIYNVKLHVRSSFNHNTGTIVEEVASMEKEMVVSGVAYDLNVAKIAFFDVPDKPGIAMKLFSALAAENINVDMIIQSTMRNDVNDISFTIAKDELNKALQISDRIKQEIGTPDYDYDDSVAKISIVGAGMITNPGVAACMFEALANAGINIQMISTSEIKVSCIIDADSVKKAVKVLHTKFDLDVEEENSAAS